MVKSVPRKHFETLSISMRFRDHETVLIGNCVGINRLAKTTARYNYNHVFPLIKPAAVNQRDPVV